MYIHDVQVGRNLNSGVFQSYLGVQGRSIKIAKLSSRLSYYAAQDSLRGTWRGINETKYVDSIISIGIMSGTKTKIEKKKKRKSPRTNKAVIFHHARLLHSLSLDVLAVLIDLLIQTSQAVCLNSSGVDTNGDVANHTLGDILAVNRHNANDRVIAVGETVRKDAVHIVGGAVDLRVLRVGFQGHDLLLEILVKVQLTCRDNVARRDGAVAAEDPVVVHLDVDVDGTVDVEAREDGLHLHHAVDIGGPHAAQEGGVIRVQVGHTDVVVGR